MKSFIQAFKSLPGKKIEVSGIGLITGIVVSFALYFFLDLVPGDPKVTATAAIALLMAIWWITEALPLGVTALLPVALFPVLGIMNGRDVSALYINHIIFLFIGGFIIALAMQRWNLHKRIAIRTLLLFGIHPRKILLGFMVVTAFLSMWISNTAAAMMMVSIGFSLIVNLENMLGEKAIRRYAVGLLLGIAYSASIGGMATPVGTPPNLAFMKILSITFPGAPEISFTQWMSFAFPLSILLLVFTWLLLSVLIRGTDISINRKVFKEEYRKLGKITYEERIVLVIFTLLVISWMTRSDVVTGSFIIPGWSRLFNAPDFINDGTVAIAYALLLFIIPSKKASRVMNWETANKLPWNIVLLFGGGFALAAGFVESGLSNWFGTKLAGIGNYSLLWIIATITVLMVFLTELTSNTATAQIFLPVLGALAVGIGRNPLLLMIPATLASSCAFMLPVATPPNAIVFGTEKIRIIHMVKAGIILNIFGIMVLTLAVYFIDLIHLVELNGFPGWAAIMK